MYIMANDWKWPQKYIATMEYSAAAKKKKEESLYLIKWNNIPDIVKTIKQCAEGLV